jgi:hypothetical protein
MKIEIKSPTLRNRVDTEIATIFVDGKPTLALHSPQYVRNIETINEDACEGEVSLEALERNHDHALRNVSCDQSDHARAAYAGDKAGMQCLLDDLRERAGAESTPATVFKAAALERYDNLGGDPDLLFDGKDVDYGSEIEADPNHSAEGAGIAYADATFKTTESAQLTPKGRLVEVLYSALLAEDGIVDGDEDALNLAIALYPAVRGWLQYTHKEGDLLP